MAHRIRAAWDNEADKFAGPVEVDGTCIGGKERSKHESEKRRARACGQEAVVGMEVRDTGQIASQVIESTDAPTLQGFVRRHTERDTQVYTDDALAYRGLPRRHEAVKHSVSEYVRGMARTNGIEYHWAMLKRGRDEVYYHFSAKRLPRYIDEFEGWHNSRPLDTEDQMAEIARKSVGKRLRYIDLIARVNSPQLAIL